mmetsp:Transcript_67640/g.161376  ORF Transcript_67640/g.161376 Transcript_67640/m.161376 type:complete len:101 (+) Transcript_67640:212-514(+)
MASGATAAFATTAATTTTFATFATTTTAFATAFATIMAFAVTTTTFATAGANNADNNNAVIDDGYVYRDHHLVFDIHNLLHNLDFGDDHKQHHSYKRDSN